MGLVLFVVFCFASFQVVSCHFFLAPGRLQYSLIHFIHESRVASLISLARTWIAFLARSCVHLERAAPSMHCAYCGLSSRGFYTDKSLYREAFAHRSFYTDKILHTEAFTQTRFYIQKMTEARTQRSLLHREVFYILLHREAFAHRSVYTEKVLDRRDFTHRSSYLEKLLHRRDFTHRR